MFMTSTYQVRMPAAWAAAGLLALVAAGFAAPPKKAPAAPQKAPAAPKKAPAAPKKAPTPQAIEFFEARVRPVLADHCHACHGPRRQRGGLRLDSQAALLGG